MKVNKYFLVFSLLLATILLVVCGKEDSPNGPDPVDQNYIPYKVGNSWTYQVVPTDGEPPYSSTLEVISKTTINGVEMAAVKEQSTQSPDDFSLIYYETKDNSLLMHKVEDFIPETSDTSSYQFDPPATWLKVPFVKDDAWQVFTYIGDPSEIPLVGSGLGLDSTYAGLQVDLTLNGTTVGEELVNAADQNFTAFKVDFNFIAKITVGVQLQIPGKLGSFWVVPEVGIVRITFYDLSGNITELRTMTEYNVN